MLVLMMIGTEDNDGDGDDVDLVRSACALQACTPASISKGTFPQKSLDIFVDICSQ